MGDVSRTLFGTDGVRGLANQSPMTGEMAMRLGRALGYRLRQLHGSRAPKVLIGKDTRRSGYLFENALTAGLCSVGADVFLLGPLPTPGIAFLTDGMRADAGVVISASHNPYEDNGIKLFSRNGYKLPDEEEALLERLMNSAELDGFRPTGRAIGRVRRIDDAVGRYSVFAKSAFPRQHTLDGVKVVIDCAHGAGYKVAPEVLRELGADVVTLGVQPNGYNINDGCGAVHPEFLARTMADVGADVGIALDGDADRCLMVDSVGQVVDGDKLLAIIGRHLKAKGQLPGDTVVATVMSNMGLEICLREVGVAIERVGVGDRYVMERMREKGYVLGGEQSGHVILHERGTTGDGLVTALTVLGIMCETGRSIADLAMVMTRLPQVLKNIKVASKPPMETLPGVQTKIAEIEQILDGQGRVLVRYSGTQKLARVMVEGPDRATIEAGATAIAEALEAALR